MRLIPGRSWDHPSALPYGPDSTVILAKRRRWNISNDVLGKGAFASVREAIDLDSGEVAVAKMSKLENTEKKKHLKLYAVREVGSLMTLLAGNHPNIVKILDGARFGETAYIFQKKVKGVELFEFLKQQGGTLPPEMVRHITAQLLSALRFLHQHHILHRDIKLDNIMIDRETLHVTIMCINYASPQIVLASQGVPYMPEQGWSDLWALGVTVFGMLCGDPRHALAASFFPFRSETPLKLAQEHARLLSEPLEWFGPPPDPLARSFVERILTPRSRGIVTCEFLAKHPFVVGHEALAKEYLVSASPVESLVVDDDKLVAQDLAVQTEAFHQFLIAAGERFDHFFVSERHDGEQRSISSVEGGMNRNRTGTVDIPAATARSVVPTETPSRTEHGNESRTRIRLSNLFGQKNSEVDRYSQGDAARIGSRPDTGSRLVPRSQTFSGTSYTKVESLTVTVTRAGVEREKEKGFGPLPRFFGRRKNVHACEFSILGDLGWSAGLEGRTRLDIFDDLVEIKIRNTTHKVHTGLFINGEFVPAISGKTFPTINPATGEVICHVCEADKADIDVAVRAARTAFKSVWRNTDGADRGRLLYKLADLVERDIQFLADLEALDNGKKAHVAKGDVEGVVGCLSVVCGGSVGPARRAGPAPAPALRGARGVWGRWDGWMGWIFSVKWDGLEWHAHEVRERPRDPAVPAAGWADKIEGKTMPWNFPLGMLAWKFGPALATGNVIILKSSEKTPLTALAVAALTREAGFPPGVINIVSGYGPTAGQAMVSHPEIMKLAFTGSTRTGRMLVEGSAKSNLKKVTLELGGKSPSIVFEDADIDEAAKWTNMGIFFNHGQVCCAGSRVYVQESVAEKFLAKFKELTEAQKTGDQFDEDGDQGPLVDEIQFNNVLKYIEIGKKEAKLIAGGGRLGSKGFYIQPTVFSNVPEDATIMKEEIFGPVVCVSTFKTEEEIIAKANATPYGLAGAVFTKDLNRAIRVSNELEAGMIWVNAYNIDHNNTPFGGYKESGWGRELGAYGLDAYLQIKSVKINMSMTL
ncbi:aldehyde dehydrogenase (NAD(P)(+)) ald5 [Gonapodya sp. JEL0774]|nr:aldehyde dehydrogenase (NAD(P)(+)) ald5 [Gonapodya sp. JEL0774]